MKVININSVSEYVAYIETMSNKGDFWFRGVPSPQYKPLPGLIWRNIVSKESSLEHCFLISYKSYLNSDQLNAWEVFALMQHHGLPTRLLDWSESAMVALYFALASEPSKNGERVVWAMNPYELNKESIGLNHLFCPSVINSRIVTVSESKQVDLDDYLGPNLKRDLSRALPEYPIAVNASQNIRRVSSQKGCFTVHGWNTNSIDKFLKNDNDFFQITINVKSEHHRLEMIDTLSNLGIDEEFIYQDLDALCDKVKRICRVN